MILYYITICKINNHKQNMARYSLYVGSTKIKYIKAKSKTVVIIRRREVGQVRF